VNSFVGHDMSSTRPGRSLFRLLVMPVVGLVLVAVIANVGFEAFLAVRRTQDAARAQQDKVAKALEQSRVALSQPVLDTLKVLTGSDFVIWNPTDRRTGFTTLAPDMLARHDPRGLADAIGTSILLDGRRYHVGTARSGSARAETVLVFTPVRSLMITTLEAIWPVLVVAAATLAVLIPVGTLVTARLARRIGAVEKHVARIAGGQFGERLVTAHGDGMGSPDEIDRLVDGVNHLSQALAALRQNLVAGERQRLLGQLAAGFAHELRNAVTGAKLAIDLHRRRCAAVPTDDTSLIVASRQLDVLEEEVRGLLALGRPGDAVTGSVDWVALGTEVIELTELRADHAGVRMAADIPANLPSITGRRESLRAALVNLMLNAIDAAERTGHVWLRMAQMDASIDLVVEDDGPGPPPSLTDSLTEPFVTGKREGIGLGLAVARAVAEEHGGTLSWSRHDGRTRFTMRLPFGSSRP
jgi:signal transduction histidine kinase